jgi:hypothetical protein
MGEKVRRAVLAKLDQCTGEARILHSTREELTEHIGGHPSATERALIDRAASFDAAPSTNFASSPT